MCSWPWCGWSRIPASREPFALTAPDNGRPRRENELAARGTLPIQRTGVALCSRPDWPPAGFAQAASRPGSPLRGRRGALIHRRRIIGVSALAESLGPARAAMGEVWPEAAFHNLLDEALVADLASFGGLAPHIGERFLSLAQ